jgi:hypothetical protein
LSDEDTRTIQELTGAVETLTAGLSQLCHVLAHHGTMLSQILSAVADREDDDESPLITALTELIGLSARHAQSLDRIEDRLMRIEKLST